MTAPKRCRFFLPMALALCGPLVGLGLAAEPIRPGNDTDKEVIARKGKAPTGSSAKEDPAASGGPSAAELVRDALSAEAAGKSAERQRLLRLALETDPNYGPARWHLGYVRTGKEWLKWDEVQRRAAGDPRLAEYRRRFDELAGTPEGQLVLARWCRDQGLDDHARSHWLWLLGAQPQNEEALKALGMRWYQGQLMTHEQIVAARRGQNPESADPAGQRTPRKDWNKHWAPRVTKWQRMLQEGDAALNSAIREELEAIEKLPEPDFRAAMQGLDSILMIRSHWKKEEAAYRVLSLKWVEILDEMPDQTATVLLARQAVDHPTPDVRAAAADALKKRPKESYVPILVGRMQSPVEANFAIQPLFGSVTWAYTFYQEGPVADRSVTRVQGVAAVLPEGPLVIHRWGEDPARDRQVQKAYAPLGDRVKQRIAKVTVRGIAQASATASRIERVVATANASIEELNRRAREALVRATGTDCGESMFSWWKWWKDWQCAHYDLEKPSSRDTKKPRYEHSSAATAYVTVPLGSCFPRGTVVWTLTGPAAIEKIKIGDRVLSQHPSTGELTYRPVIETTTRKPESWRRISLGSETITATGGHPFLVAGEGWKMAKQLKVGMRLHAPSGSAMIDALEDVSELKPFYERLTEKPDADPGDDLAYNLVVDESHTYFVGRLRVLVFDNLFASLANQAQAATALAR